MSMTSLTKHPRSRPGLMLLPVSLIDLGWGRSLLKIHIIAYESFRTVGSLLLTNPDFRLFVNDLSTIGRQVLADTAFSLAGAAEKTGKQLDLSDQERKTIQGPGADEGSHPTKDELKEDVHNTTQVIGKEVVSVGKDAVASVKENLLGAQTETLLYRL